MENASKALIIAGAILLAILIISLGIVIYNQAAGVVNTDQLNSVEISSFNKQFTQYEGNNKRGAEVNALLDTIQSNNVTYQTDTTRQIEVSVTASTWGSGTKPTGKIIQGGYAKASTGATYSITCTTDSKTGLVTKVTIGDAGTTSAS